MYAVLIHVDLKPGREADHAAELDDLATWAKTVPGLVRATWANHETKGISFSVFDNEAAARELAANASIPAEASVSLASVDVYEIVKEV